MARNRGQPCADVTAGRNVHGNLSVNRKCADLAFVRLELDDIMGHFLLVQCSRSEFTDP